MFYLNGQILMKQIYFLTFLYNSLIIFLGQNL